MSQRFDYQSDPQTRPTTNRAFQRLVGLLRGFERDSDGDISLTSPLGATSGGTGQSAVARGDLLYGSAANTWGKRTVGAAGKLLRSDGTDPQWSTATFPDTAVAGDLPYASATNTWSSLAKGTARQLLQMNSGATAPEWTSNVSVPGTLGVTGATTATTIAAQSARFTGAALGSGGTGVEAYFESPFAVVRAFNQTAGTYQTLKLDGIETVIAVSGTEAARFESGGALQLVASSTATARLRIPHGAAPTAPVDGDVWTTSAGLFVRINGATVGPLS